MRLARVAAMLGVLLVGAGASGAGAAEAGVSDAVRVESGSVRLVSATTAVGEAGALRLGVQFKLEPGWKIYWRSPGDAGYPPKISWDGSDNMGQPRLSWPAPTRFVLAGLQNHGYTGEVLLPVDGSVPAPGRPVRVRAEVDFLACAQICVPQQASLALDLPAGPAEPSAAAHDIGRYWALVPGDGARHGLALRAAEAVGEGDRSALRLTLTATEPLTRPDAFIEAEGLATFDQPRVTLSEGGRRAVIEVAVVPGTLLTPLAGAPLTVTVVDGTRALEAAVSPVEGGAPSPSPSSAAPVPESASLAAMLAVALLGGLILNLMPCVLPVLCIKVAGVLGHGGGDRLHVRAAFLASAAGIWASFLALAGLAVAVKATGAAFGWGIQFQQPGFLSAMVVLLALFAANLWGLFEIGLPSWLMRGGAGGGVPHHTLLGHFLSGAFATLLATPCSAPFLGTAVGFALARGPAEIFAIFAALGIGMALPFLAVAAWPEAATALPRPGRWMVRIRMLMGLALAGTALWLLTVLMVQAGPWAALIAGGAMAAAVGMLALRARLPERARPAVAASVAALAALALAAPYHEGAGGGGMDPPGASAVPWIAFDRDAIPRLVSEGKTVFVDVTADWCITCKVNKAAVIERGEVARRLSSAAVVAMKADWTRPNDRIAQYLAAYGRYGIPFNAVYGPGAPGGIPLSELLTETETLAALAQAAGSRPVAAR